MAQGIYPIPLCSQRFMWWGAFSTLSCFWCWLYQRRDLHQNVEWDFKSEQRNIEFYQEFEVICCNWYEVSETYPSSTLWTPLKPSTHWTQPFRASEALWNSSTHWNQPFRATETLWNQPSGRLKPSSTHWNPLKPLETLWNQPFRATETPWNLLKPLETLWNLKQNI